MDRGIVVCNIFFMEIIMFFRVRVWRCFIKVVLRKVFGLYCCYFVSVIICNFVNGVICNFVRLYVCNFGFFCLVFFEGIFGLFFVICFGVKDVVNLFGLKMVGVCFGMVFVVLNYLEMVFFYVSYVV